MGVCFEVMSSDGMMEIEKPVNVIDSNKPKLDSEEVEDYRTAEEAAVNVVEIEKSVNVDSNKPKLDSEEVEEYRSAEEAAANVVEIEKSLNVDSNKPKFEQLDSAEVEEYRSVEEAADNVVEIEKSVNVDSNKPKFEALDTEEVEEYRNAEEAAVNVVEIEKPVNVDSNKPKFDSAEVEYCTNRAGEEAAVDAVGIEKQVNVDSNKPKFDSAEVEYCTNHAAEEAAVNAVEIEKEKVNVDSNNSAEVEYHTVEETAVNAKEIEKHVNVDSNKQKFEELDSDEVEEHRTAEEAAMETEKPVDVDSNKRKFEALDSAEVEYRTADAVEIEKTVYVDSNKLKFEALDSADVEYGTAEEAAGAVVEIEKPVNNVDSNKQKLDCAEVDCCTANRSAEEAAVNAMEIEKPVNVDSNKRKFGALDSEQVEYHTANHVTEEAGVEIENSVNVVVDSNNLMEIEKSVNVDSKKPKLEVSGSADVENCTAEEAAVNVKSECLTAETVGKGDEMMETEKKPVNVEVKFDALDSAEVCCTANSAAEEALVNVELQCATNCMAEELDIGEEKQGKVDDTGFVEAPVRIEEVKEASNDDMLSEVSNPNVSPRDNTSSFQTPLSSNQGASGEITSSFSSGNSSTDENASGEEHNRIAKSSVVLEIPKEYSTTGVRKITFKFSKRKEDYGNVTAPDAAPPVVNDVSETLASNPILYSPNMEEKISKVISDAYPTNVKKLLSTGILEGARVRYISTSGKREIPGIIKDNGYLCGCQVCNYSNVLSAYEFEVHAGSKTRHPNNHIYLENGKPIYRIIQELKAAPLNQLEEVVKDVAGPSINEQYLDAWKGKLLQKYEVAGSDQCSSGKASGTKHLKPSECNPVMDDGLIPATYSYIDQFPPNSFGFKETSEAWKHVVKRPRCTFSSSVVGPKKTAEGGTKKRDNDLHRSLFMPCGLPDGTDLAYYSKGKKILGGYKQGNGIVCSCCDTEISPSQFEAHAGCSAKRQPYRHIYTSNGLTLHDIALMLANGQSIATNSSDDMCTICGDGGELVFCEGCPRAFHTACLGRQCTPHSGWLCSHCRDNFVPGRRTAGDAGPIMVRLTRVVKAPESEGGGCVVCRSPDFSVAKFDDRTVMLCDQCEKEYHVGCLREIGLCDLKELPKDKWFCCSDCSKVYVELQNCISTRGEVIPAPAAAAVTKKNVQKCLMDAAADDIQWRILSGKSRYPEHLPLLSRAAAIFRECFDPIVARSGRDLIPVMVYGRNISGQEFGGMYCVVLIVKSVVVSAGLIRIFGQEVAELPLVATSRENQGKGYFQALFGCIETLLCSMHVKNLVLPAAEEAESIWTNKLGFKKMTDERYQKYSKDYQLTVFKGTSMLEKEVQNPAHE